MNEENKEKDFSWSKARSTVSETTNILLASELTSRVKEALGILNQSKELYEKREIELEETIKNLENDIENRRLSRELVLLSKRLEDQLSTLETERDTLRTVVNQRREAVDSLMITGLKKEIEELENEKKKLEEKKSNLHEQEADKNSQMRILVALYFMITNIKWNYKSEDISGTILSSDVVSSFNIKKEGKSPYTFVNELWSKLDE